MDTIHSVIVLLKNDSQNRAVTLKFNINALKKTKLYKSSLFLFICRLAINANRKTLR